MAARRYNATMLKLERLDAGACTGISRRTIAIARGNAEGARRWLPKCSREL